MKDLILQIYDDIRNYYPIGFSANSPFYRNSFEHESYLRKCRNNKIKSPSFDLWENNIDTFSPKNKWNNTTCLISSCYSAFVVLDSTISGQLQITSSFHLELSVLGDYYVMYGKKIIVDNQNAFLPNIYVSPMDIFHDSFRLTTEKIAKLYPSFVHLPFRVLKMEIVGLDCGQNSMNSNLYQALFNPSNILDNTIIGNQSFFNGRPN